MLDEDLKVLKKSLNRSKKFASKMYQSKFQSISSSVQIRFKFGPSYVCGNLISDPSCKSRKEALKIKIDCFENIFAMKLTFKEKLKVF